MKSLEILKEGVDFMKRAIKVNPNSVKELQSEIDRYIEAINELEEFNNRSCGSCNYYTGTVCYYHEGWCDEIGVVHPTMENNDCCNRYEKKDSE